MSVGEKFEQKILESIEVLDPSIENKEEFAKSLASEIVDILTPTVNKQSLKWDDVIKGIVEVINDQELLETYKGLGTRGVRDIWLYAVMREKKKYRPRGYGVVEDCTIIPYGISSVRKMRDTPTCVIYALLKEENSYKPISIFCRGQFRMLAKKVDLLAEYETKLENRGFFYEAVSDTDFINPKYLDIESIDFYTQILPKFGLDVKYVDRMQDLAKPENISKLSDGWPEETSLRIVTGIVVRKTLREEDEKCVYAIYDNLDEAIPTDDYVVPVDLPLICNPVFGEFEEDDWVIAVGHITPIGDTKELIMFAINIIPKFHR